MNIVAESRVLNLQFGSALMADMGFQKHITLRKGHWMTAKRKQNKLISERRLSWLLAWSKFGYGLRKPID